MAVALTSYNELKRNPVFKKVEILNETKKSEPAIFQPSSLKTLCLQKITAFNKLIRSARDVVPREVLTELAEVCMEDLKYNQINLLLQSWPYPTFKVKSKQFSESVNFCEALSDDHVINRYQHVEQIRFLISILKKILKHRNSEGINIINLDITNCPVDARVLFNSANSESPEESEEICILPGEAQVSKSLNIITDFHLNEQSPLTSAQRKRIEEVYKNVKIQIRHLYIEILDTSFIERIACNCLYHENLLLSHLLLMKDSNSSPYNFNHVEGIQLSRLDLRSAFNGGKARAVQFFDGLKRVINPEKIKKIDLSSNAINVNGDDQATEILANFLSSFPCLRKLDLRGNRLTNKVGCILKKSENLEYLNLSGCQMRQIDVSFLSSLQKLTHLDISNNYLGNKLNALKTIFKALKKLKILEMEDCQLSQDGINELQPYLRSLPNLQLLNLISNNYDSIIVNCTVIDKKSDWNFSDSDESDDYY